MDRAEMAHVAQEVATAVTLPSGARIVIVVTDVEGTFVGVGSNTSVEDATAILFCALAGADRIDHVVALGRSTLDEMRSQLDGLGNESILPLMTPERELAALRWLAKDDGGRIKLTDAGRARLAELEAKR